MPQQILPGGGGPPTRSHARGLTHGTPTPKTLSDEMAAHLGLRKLKLDSVSFWMNPQSWDDTQEQLRVVVQTAAGIGSFEYGAMPATLTIEGTTGNAGVYGPGGLKDMERFRPRLGRAAPLWRLEFPTEFSGYRVVRIKTFRRYRSNDNFLWGYYRLELQEFPPAAEHPAILLSSATSILSIPVPIGG